MLKLADIIGYLGQQVNDTGWINCSLGNGISAYSVADIPQVRKIGKSVHLRGVVKNSTSWTQHDSIITIPSGFRPAVREFAIQTMYGTFRYKLTINTNGVCEASHITNNTYGIYQIPTGQWLAFSHSWLVG